MASKSNQNHGRPGQVKDPARDGRLKQNRERGMKKGKPSRARPSGNS